MNENNYAVLMAGGVGSRFWPVSTTKEPKQFRDLLGTGETLIQTTFRRLSKMIPRQNILILTNEIYEDLVKEQIPGLGPEQVVLEPAMRNTAPAVLLAALKVKKKDPDAVMIMAPSDHWIENAAAFEKNIETAFDACRGKDKILTLGIKPTFPNTGYGYIRFDRTSQVAVKAVHEFTEKPQYELAKKFLQEKNYLWNAGIFVWNVDFITRSFKRNLPEMYDLLSEGKQVYNTPKERVFIKEKYPLVENISIDYGILEKEKDTVSVIEAEFDWNDLGTWGSLYDENEKEEQDNVVLNARLYAEDSSENIISSASGKVVVLDGIKNYIVVDEKDVLLIVPREKEQEIKQIRAKVQEKFGNNLG